MRKQYTLKVGIYIFLSIVYENVNVRASYRFLKKQLYEHIRKLKEKNLNTLVSHQFETGHIFF